MAAPTATIVVADTALAAGETSLVTITFSEAVTGFDVTDLTAANGALSSLFTSDNTTYTAILSPAPGVSAPTNVITLDNTAVANLGGEHGLGVTYSNNYALDPVAPTATIVVADTALRAGETSLVTITFSEAVTGLDLGDLTAANGALSMLSTSDNITYTAILTPTTATTDPSNLITLDNSGVVDIAGNAGVGATDSNSYAIDTQRPTATILVADAALGAGETSLVTITFSEAVSGFSNADLTVANGALSPVSSSDGGITWTATLTPTPGVTDASNLITLDNAGVADLAGNAGTGATNSNNYAVDTAQPEPPPPSGILIGTPFADVIWGDHLDNLILARAGNDAASGGGGNDSIAGDEDDDVLQGNTGADSVFGGSGDDIVLGGQGDDLAQGNTGADRVFGDKGDDTVHGGQGNDIVQGGEGDDQVAGDHGDDTVRGGLGNDQVHGGDGDDFVSGDKGADTLTGGLGADLFHAFAGADLDYVVDFNLAEGDRVMLDSGTIYTLTQAGADTVVTMAGGGQMILAGVQLSSLTGDWIFTA